MLENIKHSIVLLQIAKNTAHPINGIYQGPMKIEPDITHTASGNSVTDAPYSAGEYLKKPIQFFVFSVFLRVVFLFVFPGIFYSPLRGCEKKSVQKATKCPSKGIES